VASALALAGWVLDRQDFVDAAVEGARHVIALGSHADGSRVLPHTIPNAIREVEPLTYTWCHGPTGTSQLFPALALAGVDQVCGQRMDNLRARCLQTVLDAGVPQRLRPGFWDNDGRCCGTAGVGDVLLDLAQDTGEQREGLNAKVVDRPDQWWSVPAGTRTGRR